MKHYLIHIEEINGNQEDKETFIVNKYDKDKIVELIKESEEDRKE